MDSETVINAFLFLISVLISSISQVLLKKSAMRHYDSVIREYLNPMVILAYAVFAAASFLAVTAYRKIPLSMGSVLETTGYFYVTVFGVKIFREKMNAQKFLGLGLIMAGILISAFWE